MDNHQMKLCILYPAQDNRRVFEKESAVSQRFARCEKALTNGRFAVTLPGEIIILPPGWLHATLTVNRGALFGSTMIVAEGVSAAAQSYKHDVITKEIDSFHDLNPLVCSLLQALLAELDDQWQEALSYLCRSSVPKFENGQSKSAVKDVINTARSVVRDKKHQACKHCRVELLEHFPFDIGDEHARTTNRRKLDI
ncbi:hypothetical protein AG0111_0g11652 [Alternaria gaisen]|uniref:Uncharacterized protein n=1 Tax=Alternaria gaisen TaxID=167740 RepID=A0ACB6F6P5_9PLEO|nr:hypothetical protein AG0111_0g11652 [Alternaria gaisen]